MQARLLLPKGVCLFAELCLTIWRRRLSLFQMSASSPRESSELLICEWSDMRGTRYSQTFIRTRNQEHDGGGIRDRLNVIARCLKSTSKSKYTPHAVFLISAPHKRPDPLVPLVSILLHCEGELKNLEIKLSIKRALAHWTLK
jgi:hypothetical protein